ncbi:11003_t:CDS:1 [Dentiscutata heterogama]|uniref:11003_t:CDS:1 n=1 Tax=Dentiscutata heterogama TaxID=1316150 RepID=A0ACA9L4J5_9GLOM|nr:11003_t:CDS:1 [Dentiscutata heterogama]
MVGHELILYEREPPEEIKNNKDNRLSCWKSLSKRFPIHSNMARDYLSIQPSSVASERAFSRAGFTVTHNRANLSEKTVSSTILMCSWLLESQNKFGPLHALPETE